MFEARGRCTVVRVAEEMSQMPSSQVVDPPLHLPASPSLSHSVTLPSVRSRRAHLPQAPHRHSEVRHTRVPTPPMLVARMLRNKIVRCLRRVASVSSLSHDVCLTQRPFSLSAATGATKTTLTVHKPLLVRSTAKPKSHLRDSSP